MRRRAVSSANSAEPSSLQDSLLSGERSRGSRAASSSEGAGALEEKSRRREGKKLDAMDPGAHHSSSRPQPKKNSAFLKLAAATALLVLLGFLCAASVSSSLFGDVHPPLYLRRLPGPRVAALPQFLDGDGVKPDRGRGDGNSSSSSWASRMLWGTYRSGSYLGLRTRAPRSLSAGLMWFDPDARPASEDGAPSFGAAPTLPPLRHEAQERDRGGGGGLQTFGWIRHDGETYGEQRIVDLGGALELSTTFVKREVRGSVGGDWALRVSAEKGRPSSSSPEEEEEALSLSRKRQRISLLFYVADEGVLPDDDESNGPLELAGRSPPIEILPAADMGGGGGGSGEREAEGRERGRRRRASAAAEAFAFPSAEPSKPVLLAAGAGSHPVGPWRLSLAVAAPPSPPATEAAEGRPAGRRLDLRYLGRRRPEPGGLLRDLAEAVAAELEVGAAASAAASAAGGGGGASAATGLRARRRGAGEKAGTRPPLSRHALPNEVDEGGFDVDAEDEDGENRTEGSNLAVFQLTAELPFEADFVFVGGGGAAAAAAGSAPSPPAAPSPPPPPPSSSSSLLARLLRLLAPRPRSLLEEPLARIPASSGGAPLLSAPLADRVAGLSGPALSAAAAAAAAAFDARFEALFASKLSGQRGLGVDPKAVESVSKAAISNLLGGMAYFYGSPRVNGGTEERKKEATTAAAAAAAAAAAPPPPVLRGAPGPLFTATPSRAFFPRGFLWDEGFHQLVLLRWSRPLARDALAHWCDAVTATGWIPREQILGAEAEARVPAEFVAQDPAVANPPTLLLPLSAMARGVAEAEAKLAHRSAGGGKASPPSSSSSKTARLAALAAVDPQAAADAALLEAAYPRVKRWVEWLLETQAGGEGSGVEWQQAATSFRWRGRDASAAAGRELNPKTLASGLDDYPRASHPDEHEERHVDLLCWAALAARLLATVAAGIGGGEGGGEGGGSFSASADAARFSALAASLGSLPNLRKHHWDPENRGFFDWGYHTDNLALDWRYVLDEETGYPVDREFVRVLRKKTKDGRLVAIDAEIDEIDGIDELDEAALAVPPRFVSHVGYVSLFPFLLRLLPRSGASEELGASLDQVEELLDPQSGLASLSRLSSFHAARNTEHDAPYWRGAVWPPINYLALAALDFYAREGGEGGGGGAGGAAEARLAKRAAGLRDRLRAAFVGNVVARATAGSAASDASVSAPPGVCDIWERYDDDGTQGAGVDGRPLGGGGPGGGGGSGSSPGEGLGPRPFTGWGSTVALAGAGIYFDL